MWKPIRFHILTTNINEFRQLDETQKWGSHVIEMKEDFLVIIDGKFGMMRDYISKLPGVTMLPDPHHPHPISDKQAQILTKHGVTPGSTAHQLWTTLHKEYGPFCDPDL